MSPKERKLSKQSRRRHPRVVQSASWPVHESSTPRVGNPRVEVSASCRVTYRTYCTNIVNVRISCGFTIANDNNASRFLCKSKNRRGFETELHYRLTLRCKYVHCESKKQGTTIFSITLQNVDRFSNFFHWQIFTSKYAAKSSLTIPPHLKGVAELPCQTSVSENSENLMHASLSTTDHKVV